MLKVGLGMTGLAARQSARAYSAEASALFAAMVAPPTAPRKALVDTLIVALKTAAVWTKLDGLYVLAAHSQQASLINWTAPTSSAAVVNSPAFTVDRGWSGDAVSGRLDTGFNPATAPSPKFKSNSAHLGVWSLINNNGSTFFDIGQASTARLNPVSSIANTTRAQINDGGLGNFGAAADSRGHFVINRSGAASREAYAYGAPNGSDTAASAAVLSGTITVLYAGSASGRQIAVSHFGSSLTAADVAAMKSAFQTYLVALGAA